MKMWMSDRLGPAVMIALTLGLVLAPVKENWEKKPKDNFPLSYFPMFSASRGKTYSSPSLLGWTRDGERRIVPYTFAGGGGLNEVRRQVRTRIQEHNAKEVCRKVAQRLARSKRSEAKSIERVQVITATHNLQAYFHGDKRAVKEKIHASCPVVREQNQEPGQ